MSLYHIWTIGCQMNVADSASLAGELEALGFLPVARPEDADVLVLNTCVVRQSAEDKAIGRLTSLKPFRRRNPEMVLAVMGCLVGVRPSGDLSRRFSYVDVFLPPSDPSALLALLRERGREGSSVRRELDRNDREPRSWRPEIANTEQEARGSTPQVDASSAAPIGHGRAKSPEAAAIGLVDVSVSPSPDGSGPRPVTAYVPVIYGCNHVCSYCIVPYRRGRERSRPVAEVVSEVQSLVDQGVREVTLLGQIVDRYGHDLMHARSRSGPDLADLLRAVHDVEGLLRIRFLTSHPLYLGDGILCAVAELPKVCEHIEVPVQAGDDDVLGRMRRGYTADQYRELVRAIRERVPECSIATDVIVGFPDETAAQFQATYQLLEDLRLDQVHVAAYSPRSGTSAARNMPDSVPAEEKKRRLRAVDSLQQRIVGDINARLQDQIVQVLVEERHRGKWRGRTRTNKLVFFEHDGELRGKLATVRISWTGPWSMQGVVAADQSS